MHFFDSGRRFFSIALCCMCVSLAGCMSHIYTPYQPHGNRTAGTKKVPLIKNPTARFSYTPQAKKIQEIFYANRKIQQYKIFHLNFPSAGENGHPKNWVHAGYYRSTLPGQHRLLVVLPVWGGGTVSL